MRTAGANFVIALYERGVRANNAQQAFLPSFVWASRATGLLLS